MIRCLIQKAMDTKALLAKEYSKHALVISMLILLPALFMPADYSYAKEKTPYGTTCYDQYGASGRPRTTSQAIGAVRKYFRERGYYVKLLGHNMHFLKVEVYDDEEVVDTVIVDIRSGRIRSVK